MSEPEKAPEEKSLGQICYEGYFKKCEGKSLISGAYLPAWNAQQDSIKEAWEAAAQAVVTEHVAEMREAIGVVEKAQ